MKLNKALADGIFVGVFVAVFAAVVLHLTLTNMNLSGEHGNEALSSFFGAFPIFVGVIAGLYAGKFAYHVRNRRSESNQTKE